MLGAESPFLQGEPGGAYDGDRQVYDFVMAFEINPDYTVI
jgi:hypothetical protein